MGFDKTPENINLKGRKKGTKNKITREIKDVINKLLECSTDDDIKGIYDELRKDKPEVILNFWGKIAPKVLDLSGKIKVDKEIDLSKLTPEELHAIKKAQDIINKCVDNDSDTDS